jgi:glycosyltransferase involved in cell wall biosynthesis
MRLRPFVEYLEETVPILQVSTVGILPFIKRDQGKSGHSLLANLAMGIPTVATPYAECDHIIRDGENGFLVHHPDDWYAKIKTLFDDAHLRRKFRDQGWRDILGKYDVPVIAMQLWECLRSL